MLTSLGVKYFYRGMGRGQRVRAVRVGGRLSQCCAAPAGRRCGLPTRSLELLSGPGRRDPAVFVFPRQRPRDLIQLRIQFATHPNERPQTHKRGIRFRMISMSPHSVTFMMVSLVPRVAPLVHIAAVGADGFRVRLGRHLKLPHSLRYRRAQSQIHLLGSIMLQQFLKTHRVRLETFTDERRRQRSTHGIALIPKRSEFPHLREHGQYHLQWITLHRQIEHRLQHEPHALFVGPLFHSS